MVNKLIVGFVNQSYDEKTGKCVCQSFMDMKQVVWKTEDGKPVAEGIYCDYEKFPCNMVQPKSEK